jgi:phage-related protein
MRLDTPNGYVTMRYSTQPEIVCDSNSDTFRAVYTLRLEGWIYVLHCFQKKSKSGVKTPKRDVDLIRKRLKDAQALHAQKGRDKARRE